MSASASCRLRQSAPRACPAARCSSVRPICAAAAVAVPPPTAWADRSAFRVSVRRIQSSWTASCRRKPSPRLRMQPPTMLSRLTCRWFRPLMSQWQGLVPRLERRQHGMWFPRPRSSPCHPRLGQAMFSRLTWPWTRPLMCPRCRPAPMPVWKPHRSPPWTRLLTRPRMPLPRPTSD